MRDSIAIRSFPNVAAQRGRRTLGLLAAVLALAGGLSAQTASYTYIKQPPGIYQPKTPWLTALNLPRVGTTFNVRIPHSEPGTRQYQHYYFATGFRNPNLKFRNPIFGHVYTSAEVVVMSARSSTKFTTVSVSIPNSAHLLGVHFYQQVWMNYVDRFASLDHWILGRGGHGVIGR